MFSRKSILSFTILFLLVFVTNSTDAIIAKLQEAETKSSNFSASAGEIIDVNIYINTMGNQLAGVSIFLSFDDKYFELIDAKPEKDGIQPVEDGPLLNWQIVEEDTHGDPGNSIPKFQIDYAEITLSQESTKAGDGVMGTIHLKTIKPVASTQIVFDNSKFHNRVTECLRLGGNGQFQAVKFTELTPATIAIKGGPQITSEIPDVTILLGQTDTSLALDDYVDDVNTPDSVIAWQAEGGENIEVSIEQASHVVMFQAPDDWTGSETITFTASDPEGNSISTNVDIHVKSAPKVEKLPDVTFLVGKTSGPIELNKFVSDVDNPDLKEIKWTYSGQTNVKVELKSGHTLTFSGDGVWVGRETITFTATDSDGYSDNAEMIVTIRPETTGPVVSDIPDIIATNDGKLSSTVEDRGLNRTFDLDDYVSDFDNKSDELIWSVSDNVNVDVLIDDATHEVTFKSDGWIGSEKITFTVTDPDSQSGSDTSIITLISEKAEPIVLDIPDVTFPAGATDTTLNLNEYVIDLNGSPDEITWTYKNNNKISISVEENNVATFTANEKAVELINFTAADVDGNEASDPMTATSISAQPPEIADLPEVKILQGETRKVFNLDDFVSDDDTPKDNINWRTSGYDEERLTISIEPDRAVLIVATEDWYGTETVTFTASDAEGKEASKECQIKVTVAPVVTLSGEITIAEGETDASLKLDEHLDDADTPKEQILWETSGADELTIDVDAASHEVVISVPKGSEGDYSIVFTAIDPDGNKGEGSIKVKVTKEPDENKSPVVKDIPDVILSPANPTAKINLNDYVHDADTPPDKITWTASENTKIEVTITPTINQATLTFQEGFIGEEDITFTAVDPDGNSGSDTIKVTVNDKPPDDKSPVVFGIPDVIIPENKTHSRLNLDDYVTDPDSPNDTLIWECSDNVNIEVTIEKESHRVTLKGKEGFLGFETITFTVTDPDGNQDSDTIKALVYDKPHDNKSPVVFGLPDVTINKGEIDSSIVLDDYAIDPDNPTESLIWKYSGNENIEVTIDEKSHQVTLKGKDEFLGVADITFTAIDPDGNSGSGTIRVAVSDGDNSPVVSGIPDVTISEGETDSSIDLDDYVTDSDNPDETLTWEYSGNLNIEVIIDEESHQVTLKGKEGFLGAENITFAATDPENNTGSDTIGVTVKLKQDTTPPTFEIFVIHNPIQPDYVDIIVISSETLKSIPRVTVELADKRRTLRLIEIGANIWKGRYIASMDASGEAEVSVTGTDLAGNKGSDNSKTFTVGAENPAAPTLGFPTFLEMRTYPNPAKQTDKLTVQCQMDGQANLTVKIYDIRGRLITTLYNNEFEKQGKSPIYEFQWNMRNDLGEKVASGVYFGLAEAINGEVSLASFWKLAIVR